MSQTQPDAETRVEMSADLRATLQRAGRYASEQAHRFVTIEHILLALNEDPDADLMLQACNVDQGRLHADISGYLGMLEDRVGPGEPVSPALDPEAARIVNSAVIAAQKSRRSEVNGAIVLAAIIGDGRTPAANMLRAQGLTFQAAIAALQSAQVQQNARPAEAGNPQPLPHTVPPAQASDPSMPPLEPANQNPPYARPDHMNPDYAAHDQGAAHGGPLAGRQRSNTTEDVLADARRRIQEQQVGSKRAGESDGASPSMTEPMHDGRAQAPRPSPPSQTERTPQPLQTEDSLARFERRPPPAMPASPADDEVHTGSPVMPQNEAPPPASPPPVPNAGQPQRPPAPPQPMARPDAGAYPAPQNFGGDPLRRPPPPDAMQPAPQTQPPYQQPPGTQPQADPTRARRQAPPMPAGRHDYGGARATRSPPAGASNGYAGSENLPVPVPSEQETGIGVSTGQLVENIPRQMRDGIAEHVEVRIARSDIRNLAAGMQGGGSVQQHDLVVTKAMSVRLRAPDGGFFIETASPETQWTESQLGALSDDFASWRWTVTPNRTGRARLQLVVSARTIGSDGLTAETALPDQVFDVRISTNYGRAAKHWFGWITAAILGGLLAKFGEDLFAIGRMIIGASLGS